MGCSVAGRRPFLPVASHLGRGFVWEKHRRRCTTSTCEAFAMQEAEAQPEILTSPTLIGYKRFHGLCQGGCCVSVLPPPSQTCLPVCAWVKDPYRGCSCQMWVPGLGSTFPAIPSSDWKCWGSAGAKLWGRSLLSPAAPAAVSRSAWWLQRPIVCPGSETTASQCSQIAFATSSSLAAYLSSQGPVGQGWAAAGTTAPLTLEGFS